MFESLTHHAGVDDPKEKLKRLLSDAASLLDELDRNIEYVLIRPSSKTDGGGRCFIAYGPFSGDTAEAMAEGESNV